MEELKKLVSNTRYQNKTNDNSTELIELMKVIGFERFKQLEGDLSQLHPLFIGWLKKYCTIGFDIEKAIYGIPFAYSCIVMGQVLENDFFHVMIQIQAQFPTPEDIYKVLLRY